MYYYAKKDGSEFGVTLEQLRVRLNNNFPPETKDIGDWFGYEGRHCPTTKWYQTAVEVFPVDGVMTWEIHEPPPDEIARLESEQRERLPSAIRFNRDMILRKYVDSIGFLHWEAMSEEERQQWKKFRQDLLDITEQDGFPDNVIWPELPNPNAIPKDKADMFNKF